MNHTLGRSFHRLVDLGVDTLGFVQASFLGDRLAGTKRGQLLGRFRVQPAYRAAQSLTVPA